MKNGWEVADVQKHFVEHFRREAVVYRAPGRINLIGEHTDYNDGFVLPVAIDRYCWAAISPRKDAKIEVYSDNVREAERLQLGDGFRRNGTWGDYVRAIIRSLDDKGYRLQGADVYIHSEVPVGAGLSSSAAFEVSLGFAVVGASCGSIALIDLAKLCQHAENDFIGVQSGIMDQFASCFGHAKCALFLDCRTLRFDLIGIPDHVALVVCNTMVKHQHAAGEYNSRRSECEEATRILSKAEPGVRALRDVSLEQLDAHRDRLTPTLFKRCRHVISENLRVLEAVQALRTDRMAELRQLMSASHNSLRDDFEVSCYELNLMVSLANEQAGVCGARMTGGGFGGCTINVVEKNETERFTLRVGNAYRDRTGIQPEIYVCESADGVERISGKHPDEPEGVETIL